MMNFCLPRVTCSPGVQLSLFKRFCSTSFLYALICSTFWTCLGVRDSSCFILLKFEFWTIGSLFSFVDVCTYVVFAYLFDLLILLMYRTFKWFYVLRFRALILFFFCFFYLLLFVLYLICLTFQHIPCFPWFVELLIFLCFSLFFLFVISPFCALFKSPLFYDCPEGHSIWTRASSVSHTTVAIRQPSMHHSYVHFHAPLE